MPWGFQMSKLGPVAEPSLETLQQGALCLVCAEGLGIVKIDKTPLIHSVLYFNWGGLEHCLELSPPKHPVETGLPCLAVI